MAPSALASVRTYREQMARFAGMRLLEVWYSRVDAASIVALSRGRRRRVVAERLARAQHHTNLDALPKLTEPRDGGRRFVEDPPLLTHVEECDDGWVEEVLARYRSSLSDERRRLLGRFRVQDAARKVVGGGSVGTRCYVVLLLGTATTTRCCSRSSRRPRRSWSRTPAAAATATGHRVATASGCSRRPATSSSLTRDRAAHFYVRQLWDMKAR